MNWSYLAPAVEPDRNRAPAVLRTQVQAAGQTFVCLHLLQHRSGYKATTASVYTQSRVFEMLQETTAISHI